MLRASKYALVVVCLLVVAVSASAQVLSIETPKASATVAQSFSVQGEITVADFVHVWAFPSTGPVWLGYAAASYSPPQSFGRYELITAALAAPVGTYPVVVYGHDPATNTFPWSKSVTVTVTMGPNIAQGFAAGAYVNSVALDDAFTVHPGGAYTFGEIAFGNRWPSPPTCVAQADTVALNVSATRTHLAISPVGTASLAPIRVLCGGGK